MHNGIRVRSFCASMADVSSGSGACRLGAVAVGLGAGPVPASSGVARNRRALRLPVLQTRAGIARRGKDRPHYFRLTQAEAVLPCIYLLLFLVVLAMVPVAHVESPGQELA